MKSVYNNAWHLVGSLNFAINITNIPTVIAQGKNYTH